MSEDIGKEIGRLRKRLRDDDSDDSIGSLSPFRIEKDTEPEGLLYKILLMVSYPFIFIAVTIWDIARNNIWKTLIALLIFWFLMSVLS